MYLRLESQVFFVFARTDVEFRVPVNEVGSGIQLTDIHRTGCHGWN